MPSIDQDSGDEENPSFSSPIQNPGEGVGAVSAQDPPPNGAPAAQPQPPTQLGDRERPPGLDSQAPAEAQDAREAAFQIRELKLQLELAEARARAAEAEAKVLALESSSGRSSESVTSSGEDYSQAKRRAQNEAWDKLSYVPVSEFKGNPFGGPDNRTSLGNPDRPQPYALDNDPVYRRLESAKQSTLYEYKILHPLLYYAYGYHEFLKEGSLEIA